MVLIEFPLCFIVFPILAALVVKGGIGAKFGFALFAAVLSLLSDVMCTQAIPDNGGVIGAIGGGVIVVVIAASATGKQCPLCKSRIPSSAVRCPLCQASLPQHDAQDEAYFSQRSPASSLPHGQAEAMSRLKKCPDCAEEVRAEARKCRFCGFMFLEPTEAEAAPQGPENDPTSASYAAPVEPQGIVQTASTEGPEASKKRGLIYPLTIAVIILFCISGVAFFYSRSSSFSTDSLRPDDLDGDSVFDPAEQASLYATAQRRVLDDHPTFRSENLSNQASTLIQKKGVKSKVLLHYREGSSDRRFVCTIEAAAVTRCEER